MRDKAEPKSWKEARRKRALELKERGWKQGDIAEALGISHAAVSQWVAHARAHGVASWRAKPRPRGPRKLTREQFEAIPELLAQGAKAYGFCGDVWTCTRVASALRREFAVSYHKAHVSRLLKQLDWTPQLPLKRAAQRDERLIAQWPSEVWPELKKRR